MTNFEATKLKEFEEQFTEIVGDRSVLTSKTHPGVIKQFLLSAFAQQREELVKKISKITLQSVSVTDWLRDRYGLDDDDTLNAAEVEELLDVFVSEHSLTSSVPEEKG